MIFQPKEAAAAKPSTRLRDAIPLELIYTNHRGEASLRRIIPLAAPHWGQTDWHPEPQWLLRAYDVDKQAEREFALAGFAKASRGSAKQGPSAAAQEPSDTEIAENINHIRHYRLRADDLLMLQASYPFALRDAREQLAAKDAEIERLKTSVKLYSQVSAQAVREGERAERAEADAYNLREDIQRLVESAAFAGAAAAVAEMRERCAKVADVRSERHRQATDSTVARIGAEAFAQMEEAESIAAAIRALPLPHETSNASGVHVVGTPSDEQSPEPVAADQHADVNSPGSTAVWPRPDANNITWVIDPKFLELVEAEAQELWPSDIYQWENTQAILQVAAKRLAACPSAPVPAQDLPISCRTRDRRTVRNLRFEGCSGRILGEIDGEPMIWWPGGYWAQDRSEQPLDLEFVLAALGQDATPEPGR